jgi:Phosphotransferase enzyme family
MPDSSLTAETLSRWMRSSGTLPRGTVAGVRVELEHETPISRLIFLTATYSADAPELPHRLVVKSPLNTPALSDTSSEVQFYCQLAPSLGTPPAVRCLATVEDTNTIVLEDLRATHDHPPWPLPLSRIQSELALDALVRLHAHWWESSTLGHSTGKLHTTESLKNTVQGIAAHLPAFFDSLGDALTSEARKVYERVFSSPLKPWLRLTDPRGLTIIHGDAHAWNFLFPRSGEGAAYLFDWQLWHVDVAARDLAFLIALHWYPSRRREVERPLLQYYYDSLLAQGREDYTFDELWLDYRRSVVRNLTFPIILWSRGTKPEGWWHRLECALSAYRDLGCDELL